MKKLTVLGIIFATLIYFATVAHSETKFQLNSERLPPNYKGDNIINIYNALEKQKKSAKKSELETQKQYEERLEKARQSDLFKTSYVVKYKIDPRKHSDRISYDADNKVVSIYIRYHHDYFLAGKKRIDSRRAGEDFRRRDEDNQKSIRIYGKSERTRYIGSNAFGVQKKVTEYYSKEYHISFYNVPDQRIIQLADDEDFPRNRNPYLLIQLGMEVETYKKLRNQLNVLFVGKVTGTEDSIGGRSATIDLPIESTRRYFYVLFEPIQVWLFDNKTGNILLKMDWSEQLAAEKPIRSTAPSKNKAPVEKADENKSDEGSTTQYVGHIKSIYNNVMLIQYCPDGRCYGSMIILNVGRIDISDLSVGDRVAVQTLPSTLIAKSIKKW